MLLLLWLACTDSPAPAPVAEADSGEEHGGEGEDTGLGDDPSDEDDGELELEVPAPPLDAEAVAAAISAVGVAGLPDPARVQEVYLWRLEDRPEECPYGGSLNVTTPFGGCESSDGWYYSGVAEYAGGDPGATSSYAILGDLWAISPDGTLLLLAGEIELEINGDADAGSFTTDYRGSWSWPEAEGWLGQDGASAVYTARGGWGAGNFDLELDGSFFDGTHAVRIEDGAAMSLECEGQLNARYGLRDASGYWYALDGQDCGCGPVTWADGSELGEACVDLSTAVAGLATGVGSAL